MLRTNRAVWAIAVAISALIAIVLVVTLSPGDADNPSAEAGPGEAKPAPGRVGADIEGLGVTRLDVRPLTVEGGPGEPVRQSQARVTTSPAGNRGSAAVAPSGGFARAAQIQPSPCTASLLQSVLGLVLSLVGGQSAC